jgi:hypothetical protein
MCRVRLPSFLLLGLLATPPALPQQAAGSSPVYNVELIVFRINGVSGGEDWSVVPALRGGTGDNATVGGANVGRFVQALPPSQFQLNDLEAKLRASGGYQPLTHIAWSQTASQFGTRAGFTLQRLGANAAGLGGSVFLERGQFLHLGVALAYTPDAGPTFHLVESRRIRFYEKNFFDQPGFGVIALVTPAQGARPPGR